MIQSDEIKLPAEFQVALYENLIQQLGKKLAFCMFIVMATATPPMLLISSSVHRQPRQGIAGAGCEGQGPVLRRQSQVTYDFVKRTAAVVSENFSATGQS